MPDEPAWGQFRRLARENGILTLGALKRAATIGAVWPQDPQLGWRRQVLRLMAGTTERSELLSYFQAHCVFPQLLPSDYWMSRWPALLDQWGMHHATTYPSLMVIRSCRECSLEDAAELGFSWFRLGHQLPGVEWCARHSCGLNQASTGPRLLERDAFLHIQPTTSALSAVPVPAFVHRYIRALDWLRARENRGSWKAMNSALTTSTGGDCPPDAIALLKRITAMAPPEWYRLHFANAQAPAARHPLRYPRHAQSAWLAAANRMLAVERGDQADAGTAVAHTATGARMAGWGS
jgi:hypothetical protein